MIRALKKAARKLKRALLRDEPTYYDMFQSKGERFFARLYLHQIRQTLRDQGWQPPKKLLDAGCQTGRLAIPLSQWGFKVTGVDTSDLALRRLRLHAAREAATVKTVRANLARWLPKQASSSYDAVLCTEVLYLRENWRELLAGLIRLLKPGGLGFISHRPRAYYVAEALGRKDTQAAQTVLSLREGKLWGSYYNWQTRQELEEIYRNAQMEILSIVPMGVLSWLAVNPDDLNESQQDLLFRAERDVSPKIQDSGRYLLVSFRRPPRGGA
ncbi:MAG: class I SAM-dependent methyltransferase [Candidatus Omnitrophica bacterium]|nr:class I SAM-dependent methyltransferase [Candidatus Omnitrophota bacterium]